MPFDMLGILIRRKKEEGRKPFDTSTEFILSVVEGLSAPLRLSDSESMIGSN
ncbi:MAG: hypothetical protein U7126_15775 [Microcoleus sp.]